MSSLCRAAAFLGFATLDLVLTEAADKPVLMTALWCCSQKAKIACKIRDEYIAVKDFKAPQAAAKPGGLANGSDAAAATGSKVPGAKDKSTTAKLIESMPAPADECVSQPAHLLRSMSAWPGSTLLSTSMAFVAA